MNQEIYCIFILQVANTQTFRNSLKNTISCRNIVFRIYSLIKGLKKKKKKVWAIKVGRRGSLANPARYGIQHSLYSLVFRYNTADDINAA